MFRGLFKKVVIADLLAGLGVDAVFGDPGSFSSLTLLLALYGYAFQIYNDFSGYSDIAIGAAAVLGFDMPENFNRPYLAQNVREFWARWHISLSTWLRDYLYISLGGNRGTKGRVAFNLMATMVLGGLWHGAAPNFVLWGAWHGVLLVFARRLPKTYADASRMSVFRRRFWTFQLVTVSWLLFRIHNVDQLAEYIRGLLRFSFSLQLSGLYVGILMLAVAAHFTPKALVDRLFGRFAEIPVPLQATVYAGLILFLASLSFGAPAFIYFQF
jgi:D-alanyl-lipoteichoic acid acyltransferase DltB (MBOAT superfamily)